MTTKMEIVDVGDSLGIELPEDVLKQLKVKVGGTLWLTKIPDGIRVSCGNSEDSKAMKAGRRIMAKHGEVLKKLADS